MQERLCEDANVKGKHDPAPSNSLKNVFSDGQTYLISFNNLN